MLADLKEKMSAGGMGVTAKHSIISVLYGKNNYTNAEGSASSPSVNSPYDGQIILHTNPLHLLNRSD